jgi:uncharacterized protein (DUF983 family)
MRRLRRILVGDVCWPAVPLRIRVIAAGDVAFVAAMMVDSWSPLPQWAGLLSIALGLPFVLIGNFVLSKWLKGVSRTRRGLCPT